MAEDQDFSTAPAGQQAVAAFEGIAAAQEASR